MKLLYTLLVFLFLTSSSLLAQAPDRMSYQSVIRDSENELVTNQNVRVRINLLQGAANGSPVYIETHSVATNANGLATLQIGGGTVVSGNITAIDWSAGPYFIKTETDPTGGSNFSIVATSQLLSVPYALYAANGGVPGPQGPAGPKGDKGDQGNTGPAGSAGPAGPAGPQGPQGEKGEPGDVGDEGPAGPKGDKGDTGNPGPQGAKGDKGDKGDEGDPGPQGPQGPQGLQGPQGPPGPIAGSNMQIIFNDNGVAAGDQDLLYDQVTNHLSIGAGQVNTSAALEIKSSTGALLLPRLSTEQRDALNATEGMMIYNTDVQKFQGFVGDSGTTIIAESEVAEASYFIGNDGTDLEYVAQTFTPSHTGLLQSFEFNVSSLTPGFQLTIELYEGNDPGAGTLITAQNISLNTLGWNSVDFGQTITLNGGQIYHFIIRPTVVSPEFIGILQSNASPGGEHPGGTLHYYNSVTGDFDLSLVDDMDFRINALVNNQAWVNLH